MTRVICIANWFLTTQQIWLQSVEEFLNYSFATHFVVLRAAHPTCQADHPNESNPVAVNFIELIYLPVKHA